MGYLVSERLAPSDLGVDVPVFYSKDPGSRFFPSDSRDL
jgi:hypothetical protein